MAFNQNTRNALSRMVTAARNLLEQEFTHQLQEIYGIQPDGTIIAIEELAHLGDEERDIATLLRERINHLVSGIAGEKKLEAAAIERVIREQAFTILNRFAALRMCEERELLQECVRNGINSKGFQVFLKTAGAGLGEHYDRYRTYLFCIFDEIAIDLGVLFDRFSTSGLLFPRESALLGFLDIINTGELKHVWAEDETIGWIYQYFNPPEERKTMREASQAPRNSRELAVRNQFFTPRYVVEFLTDNTLGRIWYEMRQGNTCLKEKCKYLIRRPNEVFLEEGQEPPQDAVKEEEDMSQEELLAKPVYIPFRERKDPRDFNILDPACGSGHFLLYAFDLLEAIYLEAWEDEDSPPSEKTGSKLCEEFESPDELRRAIPGLILCYNLHGIEIDPRSAQIATLALWLRAQRTYQELGLKATDRPVITRTNIVVAEPMPGEEDMLRDFADSLKPKLLGQLVQVVFDKMKLAGEAGSLLKIEEEIRDAVAEAKERWLSGPKEEQQSLFAESRQAEVKQEPLFDLSGITDEEFWEEAEQKIYDALLSYAEQTADTASFRRKMFSEDAAQGFAFIDLCRKRYDVVLMNPPFGEKTVAAKCYLDKAFKETKNDMFAMFVERGLKYLRNLGYLGSITNKTGFYLQTFSAWRRMISSENRNELVTAIDLGFGVLDSAVVETMAYIVREGKSKYRNETYFIRLVDKDNRGALLKQSIDGLKSGRRLEFVWLRKVDEFNSIPYHPMCYWGSNELINLFTKYQKLSPNIGHIYQGIATGDNFRFLRCRWEVPNQGIADIQWATYAKGGTSSLWYSDFPLIVLWQNDGSEIKANAQQCYGSASRTVKNEAAFFKSGLTYTQVTIKGFYPRVLPKGCVFDMKGPSIMFKNEEHIEGLGVLCSSPIRSLAKLLTDCRQWHPTNLMNIPYPTIHKDAKKTLRAAARELIELYRGPFLADETSSSYCCRSEDEKSRLDEHKLLNTIDNIVARGFSTELVEFHELDSVFKAESLTENEDELRELIDTQTNSNSLVSSLVGFINGRWDIRMALDPSLAPKLPDPFDPLPVCPPGMLVGTDGLPAMPGGIVSEEWLRARPDANTLPPKGSVENPTIRDEEYPVHIQWNGILVDDPGHQDDIIERMQGALNAIWEERAEEIEQEACEILGISNLRDYFRRPSGFFADHLKRYSKSRRQAPIYLPLSTSSGSYALWVYYHRLTDQTLFTCVNDYVNPKIREVIADLERLQKEVLEEGTIKKRDKLESLQAFRRELEDLREELLRIASLPYKPNLNDGVLVTASPFWRLFRHNRWSKDLKQCWDKLEAGEYDWAHLAYSIWPDRVREKCKTDRSIAIAHDLEQLCEVEVKKVRGRTRR